MSPASVLHFVLSQIAYLFGINAGPEHLNGQNFREAPMGIMILIGVADFMLLLLVVAFLLKLIQLRKTVSVIYRRPFSLWRLSAPALSAPA